MDSLELFAEDGRLWLITTLRQPPSAGEDSGEHPAITGGKGMAFKRLGRMVGPDSREKELVGLERTC